MYLGGFVMSMTLDTILEAASILMTRGRDDVRFLRVGSGTYRDEVIRKAHDSGLSNVDFPPPVSKAEIASVMSTADAFIYGIRNLPLYRYGMSLNKLMDYLAGARPIIYAGNSSYNPVAIADAGFTVPPEDAQALADAVERLVALSPEERIAMGCRGHEYLLEHHDIAALADRQLAAMLPV
jgi:glycosyltransferase involved in cell wall biosynthesis